MLGLTAWPCLGIALADQRWLAAVVSAALIVSHLGFTLPTMHPWSTAAAPVDGPTLTVYSHNVLYTNTDLTQVAAQVARCAPDVVAIVELSDANVASLAAAPEMSSYGYVETLPHEAGRGLGVWSRVPMTDAQFWQAPGYRQFHAVLHPEGQPVLTLIVVHAEAPVTRSRSRVWQADLHAFADRVRAAPGSVLLVGDFNATATMRALRPIRSAGMTDAGGATGNGWRATWPASYRGVPQVMRIDHAFHTGDLTATGYRLGAAAGSDHKPLIVTFARSRQS